tara:strand:+ start:57 stop:656 length:600 start_codon:yes stop_codon:yes gene_type:complete
MAAGDEEEEDVVAAVLGGLGSGSTSSGVQSVAWDGNFIGNALDDFNPSNTSGSGTGFMSVLKDVIKSGGILQYALRKAGLPPSTEGKTPAQVHLINRRGRGFFKNADGSWNTTHPQTGEPRKHRMVDMPFFGEVPVGPPVEIDDTTPFMLQHDSRGEINPEMVSERTRLYDLYMQYKDINPTLAQTYLDQWRNIESQYA